MKNVIIVFTFILFGCGGENKTKKEEVLTQTTSAIKTDSLPSISKDTISAFNKTVSYKKINFKVSSPGKITGNSFTIEPSGYAIVNTPVTEKINGVVNEIIIDDIDGDDNPEVAIIIKAGVEDAGSFFMYSSNKDKSMSSVYLPESKNRDLILSGYKGHDEFNFVENSFIRRFPIYKDEVKTDKFRQIQYKLQKGETSKQLVEQKIVDY